MTDLKNAVMIFKSVNKLFPEYLIEKFTRRSYFTLEILNNAVNWTYQAAVEPPDSGPSPTVGLGSGII